MKNEKIISKIIDYISTDGINEYDIQKVLEEAKKAVNNIPIKNKKDKDGNQIWLVRISEGSKSDTWYYSVKANSEKNAIKKAKKEIFKMPVPKYSRENIFGLKCLVNSLEKEKRIKEKENPDARYPNGDKINYETLKAYTPKTFRKDDEDRIPGNVRYHEADDR